MVQIWERCKPLRLISPVNIDHAMFIWKSIPDLSFSKNLSRYQNSEMLSSLNVIALSNLCMYIIRSLQVWHRLESLFFCKIDFTLLLIQRIIRMCDVQYWKSNNICNIWKIKEKLKILMTCDDLSFINTRQKTLKPSEKVFQFPGWMRKNFMPGNCSWRASAETWDASCFIEKHIFSELNRCIFQISLQYIKLVIPKILFILVLCNFNFYFKLRDPPPPKR